MQAAQSGLQSALDASGGGLAGNDLGALAGNTGGMAQLANARGYLGRAAANLANASA